MKKIDKQIIKKMINKESPIILDIGCYDGNDSREFLNLFESPKIFCFEADPRSVELFEAFGTEGLYLTEIAVCNTDGPIQLHLSNSKTRRHYDFQNNWSASSSICRPKNHLNAFKDISFDKTLTVLGTKLDTWVEKKNIENIDFIWADVNGAERELILGAKHALSLTDLFLTEYSNEELYEEQITLEELKILLPEFEEVERFEEGKNFGNILLRRIK